MLRQLVELAEQLEEENQLIPLGYRDFSSPVEWIIDISHDPPIIREANLTDPRPNRKRTSAIRPLLLADYAYYVMGYPEDGKEERAQKAHAAFLDQLADAYDYTGLPELSQLISYLQGGDLTIPEGLEPRDIVAVANGAENPLYSVPKIRDYWQSTVAEEFLSERNGTCSVCGETRQLLRTLPEDVAILGETCQIASFNTSAYESHGLERTLNASLCYTCGARAAQALNHLTKSDRQQILLADNQLAVFWTTARDIETEDGQQIDLDSVLDAAMSGRYAETEDSTAPTLAQIRELLAIPWTGRRAALLVEEGVYIAILSANRSRLVVREWIQSSPNNLRNNLRRFLDVQRVQSPWGDSPQSFSINQLVEPLEAQTIDTDRESISTKSAVEPNLLRGLLRTAYAGDIPPVQLEARLVNILQNPKVWKVSWLLHRSIALLSLSKAYASGNQDEVEMNNNNTGRLDPTNPSTAYRCGRLLAILEDAQQQAQGWDLNTTIVDRNFTAASTSPASTIPRLLNLAETAHIPKIRRERGTDEYVRQAIEDSVSAIESFPTILNTEEQGDFALGFYHQRAEIRRRREEHRQQENEEKFQQVTK